MKVLSFAIAAIALIVASASRRTKEVVDDSVLDQILSDPKLASALDNPEKLLKMLRTHLGDRLNEDEPRGHCPITVNRVGRIIRTQESQKAGAVFLSAPLVASRQECIDLCCSNFSCTTAIIKEKDSGAGCYLFNCQNPNVCFFSQNSGFSAIDVDHQMPGSLVHFTTVKSSVALPGHLYSACDTVLDCYASEHVECISGYCMCAAGYHAIGSSCYADQACGHYQFQCVNKDKPDRVQCIPVYNQCDGIPQCDNGFDELGCADEVISGNLTTKPVTPTKLVKTKPTEPQSSRSSTIRPMSSTASLRSSTVDHTNSSEPFPRIHDLEDQRKGLLPAVKGAVVALTLGLAIVTALLVFAVCQLQRMRWRSRKGRLRDGRDADYLINGMYL